MCVATIFSLDGDPFLILHHRLPSLFSALGGGGEDGSATSSSLTLSLSLLSSSSWLCQDKTPIMMATLNYNRIAICIASVIVLWVLAAAFRSHSSLSLQDLKNIASGISVSTGFGGSSKNKQPIEDEFPNQFEFDESFPPSEGSSWGEDYDAYDEFDILPPATQDGHTVGTGEKDHYHAASPGSSSDKWSVGTVDDDDDDDEDDDDASYAESGTSHHAGAGSDKAASSGGKSSSSSSGGKGSWFSSGKTKEWKLEDFNKQWLHTELGGNFEHGKELQKACAKADFTDNLVLHMMHSRGGVTNVRAGILDLVWFAILTGSHIVLPGYIIRPDATAAYNWDDESLGYYGIENMFDREWFLHVMSTYCPQMTIYPEVDAVPSTANVTHNDLFHDARADLTLVNTEESLVTYFTTWLQSQPEYQPRATNLIFINKMMWYFNWLPRPRLRKEMGHLVKISPQIRELAATAVYNLRTTQHLDAIQPEDQLYNDAYYAVHLRTEADAQQMGWMTDFGDFEAQSDIYIAKCKELVCGSSPSSTLQPACPPPLSTGHNNTKKESQ